MHLFGFKNIISKISLKLLSNYCGLMESWNTLQGNSVTAFVQLCPIYKQETGKKEGMS
jgi:hypothetical protein